MMTTHKKDDLLSLIRLATDSRSDELGKQLIALDRIRMFPTEDIVNACEHLLKDEMNEHSRYLIVSLLTEAAPERSIPDIVKLFQAKEDFVRASACGLLQRTKSHKAVTPLLTALKNDPSADVRLGAAYVLGELGVKRALPDLESVVLFDDGITSDGDHVKDEAKLAIEKIREN
jgi:HEAT repeat protein